MRFIYVMKKWNWYGCVWLLNFFFSTQLPTHHKKRIQPNSNKHKITTNWFNHKESFCGSKWKKSEIISTKHTHTQIPKLWKFFLFAFPSSSSSFLLYTSILVSFFCCLLNKIVLKKFFLFLLSFDDEQKKNVFSVLLFIIIIIIVINFVVVLFVSFWLRYLLLYLFGTKKKWWWWTMTII